MAEPLKQVDNRVGDIDLKDRVCLVTGGGSGIALAFIRLALTRGALILLADLHLSPAASFLLASHPDSIHFEKTDVTHWPSLTRLFTVSLSVFSDIPTIYVPAAGLFEPASANWWSDNDTDSMYAQLEVNAAYPMKLTRLAMRALTSHGRKGVVCTVASSSGLMGIYTAPLYCASKHAIIGFVKALAPADRIEGVRVVCLAPGDVDTPIWTSEKRAQYAEQLKSAMTPEYVAGEMVRLVCGGREYPGGTVYEAPVGAAPRVVPLYGVKPSPACVDALVLQGRGMDVKEDVPEYFRGVREVVEGEKGTRWP